jgi:hypothetical protein
MKVWHAYILFYDRIIFKSRKPFDPEFDRKILLFGMAWGEPYFTNFWEYAIPSFLQKGNIPQLHAEGIKFQLLFFTKKKDWENYSKVESSTVKRLRKYALLKPIFLEDLVDEAQ